MELIQWSEISDIILIKVSIPNFENDNIIIDNKSLNIKGHSNKINYSYVINFLYEVNAKECTGKITDDCLEFTIIKTTPSYWGKLSKKNVDYNTNWNNDAVINDDVTNDNDVTNDSDVTNDNDVTNDSDINNNGVTNDDDDLIDLD